ncbi:hypothetical protein [Intrasporangium flavum]|uniref:hypothetical protein n=1 Tax=Intrasporangium flavum TaxID=1428657 RepID=UPI00096D29D1|nr:hypothetical protein [Intrasporangium flavum]
MDFTSVLVLALFGFFVFITYQAIASPNRARTFETSTAGEGGYYMTLGLFMGFVPITLYSVFVKIDYDSFVVNAFGVWMVACTGWGLLGILLPFPILKWFVPPAYRTETEHIYPRPVIGLKRVKYLTYPDDEISTSETSTTGDSDA